MIIRRSFNRFTLAVLFSVGGMICSADTTPPAAIPSFTAQPDPSGTVGSVLLQWTAVADDGVTGTAATRYVIKYRPFDGTNFIQTESDWDNSMSIDLPPVNVAPPSPQAPSSNEIFAIPRLSPGVDYVFAIRAIDAANNRGPLSASPHAQASVSCSQQPNDGNGVAAFLPSPGIPAGEVVVTTMVYTVSSSGISMGGKVVFRVPDYWASPSMGFSSGGPNPGAPSPGEVSITTVTATGTLQANTSGQMVIVSVVSGFLASGDIVEINYAAFTCDSAGNTASFRVLSQAASCGIPTEIIGSPFARQITVGAPDRVEFKDYNLVALSNTVSTMTLVVRDQCGNKAPLTSSLSIDLNSILSFSPYTLDTVPVLSVASDFSSPFFSGTVVLSPSTQEKDIYYKLSPVDFSAVRFINMTYTFPGNSYANSYYLNVQNILTGITNTSVDTDQVLATQKSVAFSPDGDGVDDSVYVNFSLPTDTGWLVEFSSDNFTSVVRQFYGFGQDMRVSWDGFTDWSPGSPPHISDPGTYAVRIVLPGGGLIDTSLSVTLAASGVSGIVKDEANNTLGNVDINVFGPSSRFLRSNSDGTFKIYGLRPGSYSVQFNKSGYESKEISAAVTTGLFDTGVTNLARQSILIITSTRAVGASLPDVWGNYQAYTSDWRNQSFGNIHFGFGSLTADAGDNWNTTLTTYTILSLTPGLAYTIHLNIPNYSTNDFVVTLAPGEIRTTILGMSKRANISGIVELPVNPDGVWVSVEAGPDANNDGVYDDSNYTKRYYGGAYLNAGSTSGVFSIYGVADGPYALKTQAPGYIRSSTFAVVASGVDVSNVVFPPLSQGGTITGTLTITGDLSDVSADINGNFFVPVNCWSPVNSIGSYTQVQVSTSSILPSTFTLTGLEDGLYEVNVYQNGFETLPPGRKTVTVSGGVGTLNISLNQFAGSLNGQLTLPNGNVDYNNVDMELMNYGFGNGASPQVTISAGGQYSFDHLGTNFYELKVFYQTTGFYVERNLQVSNGHPVTLDISLVGNTYDVSGRVTTSASSPYNLLSYIVTQSTPTNLFIQGTSSNTDIPANRIVAKRYNPNNQNMTSGGGANAGMNFYDPKTTFFGFYDSNVGTYTISNLSPGTYQLFLNGEMNNSTVDGDEISKEARLINISTSDLVNEDFAITDGFDISGTLTVDSGDPESGRSLEVSLINSNQEVVQKSFVFLTGTSASFSLSRVPAGSYVLQVNDNQFPKKFSAEQLNVKVVSASVENQEIRLFQSAKIQGQLRLKKSSQLLTSVNYAQTLSDSFYIEARSNPWFPGGFGRSESPVIGSDGYFTLNLNPGTYDVLLRSDGFIGESEIALGKKQFVNQRIGGITVDAGQIKNLGVIDLVEGESLSGMVTDLDGVPLSNINVRITVAGGSKSGEDNIETFTDQNGSYTVVGIEPDGQRFYDVIAAPRPDTHDTRYQGFAGSRYGEVRKSQVDTLASKVVNFKLQLAKGSISGTVVTADSGELISPFHEDNIPGASIILNRRGVIPTENPIGEIEDVVNPDGTFSVKGLLPGIYDATVLARGYSSGVSKGIVVADNSVNVGAITLSTGSSLSGTILKGDGSALSENEFNTIVAIRDGFAEVLVGTLFSDASKNINSYSLSGFQANESYNILLFGESNQSVVLSSNVTVASDATLNLTLRDQIPSIFTKAEKVAGSQLIQFNFTKPLRNSAIDLDTPPNGLADDSEGAKIIRLKSGTGTLTIPTNWLTGDRLRANVTYTPTVGETSFVLTVVATFTSINADTGLNHYLSQDFTYYVGIGKQKSTLITNAGGGEVVLDNDSSRFTTQPGTFGDDTSLDVNIIFRSADQSSSLTTLDASSVHRNRVMVNAQVLGVKAYPPEMSAALVKAQATDVDPFSSFYDIFLPVGVSHFFPTGKDAQICLKYEDTTPDPYSLNIYYYNPTTNEYLLENENKSVDTDNQRICASIAHASVFTALASSQAIINGAGYTGELKVMNFPNPFDLKTKSLTLQDPGAFVSAAQTIEGTMIKMSIPTGISGAIEIQIFNVVGEKVRTLNSTTVGGLHSYLEWDGRNDHGQKVASGTYIGRFTVDGGNEKIFKMAVLK